MSMFGRLFGKKKEEITAEEAINQLRDTEAILIKKQEYYEQKIDEEIATAKKHGQKNQRLALNALKRKKHHELELSRIDGTLSKLEAQRAALEDAGTNAEVLKVLADASKSLKKANLDLDIDKVNDLMDDIGEQMQDSKELNDAISRPIGDVADEDDLMDELRQLEEEAKQAPSLPSRQSDQEMDTLSDLPTVPSGPITRSKGKVQKQDTMAELEAWAAAN
ncbi:unnamed protein product, partial [Mesorhabditis belari]|uniref:Uncharacterized protein n=1 Tax=Mesorhabditis belari TaxID=2138241 RepID=A0AAF3ETU2_9BILA